jgi:hypothetical protein
MRSCVLRNGRGVILLDSSRRSHSQSYHYNVVILSGKAIRPLKVNTQLIPVLNAESHGHKTEEHVSPIPSGLSSTASFNLYSYLSITSLPQTKNIPELIFNFNEKTENGAWFSAVL